MPIAYKNTLVLVTAAMGIVAVLLDPTMSLNDTMLSFLRETHGLKVNALYIGAYAIPVLVATILTYIVDAKLFNVVYGLVIPLIAVVVTAIMVMAVMFVLSFILYKDSTPDDAYSIIAMFQLVGATSVLLLLYFGALFMAMHAALGFYNSMSRKRAAQ